MCQMLELYTPNYEVLNAKDRITIDLLKDGQEFLEQFDINPNYLIDTVSVVYKYLRNNRKIPHNLFKFFIGAYYIILRHPFAFPAHESKEDFCKQFGLATSSLDYCVEKITETLNYIKIFDDMNFPYFIDPKRDISLNVIKNMVKTRVDEVMMRFLIYHQPINSQIITDQLVNKIIIEKKAFPEDLFKQLYELTLDLVEKEFEDYNEYVKLQNKYFF
ncbi:hypothetical protein LCGC14_1567290 [marine sediment metagenome]|uniref:Uncharacterized protein n=1 Tax=marine sediment metagenome TaxID=412755 RepID=A0A0F9IKM9_9ZZZZ